MKNCPKCGNKHTKPGTYCSRSCANSRGPRNQDFKDKVSKKLTGRKLGRQSKWAEIICECCNTSFEVQPCYAERRKHCSKLCSDKCINVSKGGYRPGSGRSKSGYYKGVYCGSTWELVWCIYALDHDINFSRFEGVLEGDSLKYIPDFLVDNTIIEIKGYEDEESVQHKTDLAKSFGYDVQVLRQDDLREHFEYVKITYDYKYLVELYDDYKPSYSYQCDCCKQDFTTEVQRKSKTKFCSRECAGRYRSYIKHNQIAALV